VADGQRRVPARRRAALIAAIGGVLAVAGIAYVAVHRSGPPPPPVAVAVAAPVTAASPVPGHDNRKELDELLGKTEPLAPENCRATDPATVTRLSDAARALGEATGHARALALLRDDAGVSSEAWALLARAHLANDTGTAEAVAAEAVAAETAAAEAVRLCPGYAVAQNLSGNALQRLGKAQAAEDAYVRALTAAPQYDAPRFNLGLLQLRQKDATSIATFTELLRRRPDHPNAHLARAQAYAMQGKSDEALADLEEAVQRQPNGAEAWAALGELRERLHSGDFQAAYCRAKQLGHARAAARCKD